MADLPKCPRGRTEEYLSDIAGLTNTAPDKPWSRKEAYLNEINKHVEGMEGDIADLNQKVAALATDFSYKGSVADYAHLPSDPAIGDVYTTEDEGYMYVWDGTRWQILNMTGAGALTGDSDPTTATEGTLGQLYLNTTSGKLFYCSATGSTYTWVSLDSPIQSISVNGTAVTPDANKNVALTIPEGIKTLTTADYNYPTSGTPTQIALWLLPAGVYKVGSDLSSNVLRVNTTSSIAYNMNGLIFIAKTMYSGWQERATLILVSDLHTFYFYQTNNQTGADLAPATIAGKTGLLKGADTQNNLTSTSQYAPLSANQGKVLKDLIDSLVIKNTGAPTTSTVGTVGMLYEDTTNGKLYQCTAVTPGTDPDPDTYTWTEVGGSSGPTVVQTTGTSTTDVMSQDAVTRMVYNQPSAIETSNIRIGAGVDGNSLGSRAIAIATQTNYRSYVGGANAIGIGFVPTANADNSIAIGARANATGAYSIAFGGDSSATAVGEMNIGAYRQGVGNVGYNGSAYRLLTGVYDPQSAHDAATKGYVDGTTETLTIADTDWSALSSSDPYTYSATVSVTATIGANSTVELINDAAVDFATYGFAIGAVDTANNTVTFYSIGAPSASKTLKVNVKG